MDGEKRSNIILSNLGWPNGLSVDKQNKRLYWTDAKVLNLNDFLIFGGFNKYLDILDASYRIL